MSGVLYFGLVPTGGVRIDAEPGLGRLHCVSREIPGESPGGCDSITYVGKCGYEMEDYCIGGGSSGGPQIFMAGEAMPDPAQFPRCPTCFPSSWISQRVEEVGRIPQAGDFLFLRVLHAQNSLPNECKILHVLRETSLVSGSPEDGVWGCFAECGLQALTRSSIGMFSVEIYGAGERPEGIPLCPRCFNLEGA